MFLPFHVHMNAGKLGNEPGFPVLFISFILGLIAVGSAVFAQISYLPGWPQATHGSLTSSINIADVDDDGGMELIFGDRSFGGQGDWWLYVKSMDGADKPGWPINLAGTDQVPALFDSDDDGKLEIINTATGLHLRGSDGATIWSLPYSGSPFNSSYLPYNVAVDDLDHDGNPEIVVTCYSGGAIFVFDAQGNVKPGWPVILPRTEPGWSPPSIYKSASLGDIDQDGLKEIVVGVDDGTNTFPSRVHCYKPDGSICPGFPVGGTRQVYRSKAVLVDIDGDGYLEIVIGKETWDLRAYRYDGNLLPGYPLMLSVRGIAVGDLYRDGSMEMVAESVSIKGNDLLTGATLPNFPFADPSGAFRFSGMGAPNLCDLSDDPGLGVIAGGATPGIPGDGSLFAFDLEGQVLSGFPSGVLYHRALSDSCVVNDLDGNGTTDICCGGRNDEASVPRSSTVYCWNTGYPYNLDNVDWAMDGFDLGHTGRWRRLYHISKAGSQLAVSSCQPANPCYLPPDGSLIAVDVTAVREHGGANPSGQDVRYSRTLGCANYEGPVIDHGDGTYTRMLRAPSADCTTDLHAWVNEFKLADNQPIVFTSACLLPPPPFSLLSPAERAPNQPLSVTLDWTDAGVYPNPNRAATYDLYFGPTSNPPLYASGLTSSQYTLSGLAMSTRYFWKVIAHNACGATASALWSFTTLACTIAPRPFVNLSPPNGATAQPLTVDLTWQASTQAASYMVYLGTDQAHLPLVSTVSGTRYAASGLCASTTYYWQIVARNACGTRQGAVWAFTTGSGDGTNHPRPVSPP